MATRDVSKSESKNGFPNEQHMPISFRRALSVLPSISLLGVAFNMWGAAVPFPIVGLLAVILFISVLLSLIVVLKSSSTKQLELLDKMVLVLSVAALAGWATATLYSHPGYGTDEIAYQQYAAQMLMHGLNPYTHNLIRALTRYRVPVQYATYTLSGGISSHWAYPDLAILITIPFILLTHGIQAGIIANVTFLTISMILAFTFLPKHFRPLASLLTIGLPILFGYAISGTNDIIMMPFLIIAIRSWNEYGIDGRHRWINIAQAVSLGLAISVQQLAWFIAPFLAVGIFSLRTEETGWRYGLTTSIKYTLTVIGTFLCVNGPFIVWNFGSWIHGILTPVLQHAIPYGQGIIDLPLFWGFGGGNLKLYTYAALVLYVGLLWIFYRNARALATVASLLPIIPFFLPTRSLAEYYMTPITLWIVGAITVRPSSANNAIGSSEHLNALSVKKRDLLAILPSIGLLLFALTSASPIKIHVTRVATDGQLERVWQVHITAQNTSRKTLKPSFEMNYIGQASPFWHIVKGPSRLKPGVIANYTLVAPDTGSMPGITTPFLVQAVTNSPETVSISPRFTPGYLSSFLTPSYVNSVVKPGQTLTFHVQLRSPFGARIYRPRVRIALGQIIYAQGGLGYSTTTINHGNPGQTPVMALTNAQGIASFRITNTNNEHALVYYQAWILPHGQYPFGYSDIVVVDWSAKNSRTKL